MPPWGATPEPLPQDIAQALATSRAKSGVFTAHVSWYSCVSSTNDVAAALANAGAVEGTVVAAGAQSAGRGRLGRTWASPPDAGLYVSIVLRPDATTTGLITLAAGVAIAEGIEAASGLPTVVKWPNDVYAGGRKLAGVLAEANAEAGAIRFVIVGFGINVMPGAYPPDVRARATSIESELGRHVDRGLVLAECLVALAERYGDLRDGRTATVIAAWRRRGAATMGSRVEWGDGADLHQGVVEGIDDSGALIVRAGADVHRILSGEVRWMP